jgi:hypothetical protein
VNLIRHIHTDVHIKFGTTDSRQKAATHALRRRAHGNPPWLG